MSQDLFADLPEDQQEDFEDLNLESNWSVGPTLWSTDWTTETVVSQLKRGNINLNPRYQRRNAWDPKRKSLFIESLILGLPIPQIILAEEKGKKGSFIVIDGKQRLLAIRQFTADADDTEFAPFKLTGLTDRSDLNGITHQQLRRDPVFEEELNSFENQTVRTVVIRNWKAEKYLYSVFLRINTGSVQLSPQELRQALHPGPFSDFVDDVSISSEALKSAMNLRQPDFRMRDVELVLRFFAYKVFSQQYSGDLKKFLDTTTEHLNADWDLRSAEMHYLADQFEEALKAVDYIFGRDQFRKWNGIGYERRINRAVFDIMTYYFSDYSIRNAAVQYPKQVKGVFENLCSVDRDFLQSLETTTKSMEANSIRFGKWAEALQDIIKMPVKAAIL